jgi:hypothetical protein
MELVGRLRDVEPPRPEAFEQARTVLRAAVAGDRSAGPAPRRPRHRPRPRALAIGSIVGIVGIGIAAAAVALIATSAGQPAAAPGRPPAGPPAAAHGTSTPLMRLAGYIQAHTGQPAGNATLIIRTEPDAEGQPATGFDLYTDSGAYYWAPAESGLAVQIAAHHDLGDGMFRREVAAALYAVNGNLAIARQKMINAPFDHTGGVDAGLGALQYRAVQHWGDRVDHGLVERGVRADSLQYRERLPGHDEDPAGPGPAWRGGCLRPHDLRQRLQVRGLGALRQAELGH